MHKKISPQAKGLVKHAYSKIPLPIRYGKAFREMYAFLQKSQNWNRQELETYQMQQLGKLLHHAYKNIPYYRSMFDEEKLTPENISSFGDLTKIPFMTKEIVKDNLAELVAQNYEKKDLILATTGGTTGMPLSFYAEKGKTEAKEWAFVWRQWNWAGLKFGQKKVVIRGHAINRMKNGTRQLWEYEPLDNALVLSSYAMTESNLPEYVELIQKFKPVAIRGYPSSLSILANHLKQENIRISGIHCVLTSSETLYPYQRTEIEDFFGAPIFDHYGNTERNALVMQCEKGCYHAISEYGIIELIGSDGNPVESEGETGEIIATGFNNYACPLIRYKTKDLAVFSRKECDCGRPYPVFERIEGRLQDFFC